jgi:hypothetical protein
MFAGAPAPPRLSGPTTRQRSSAPTGERTSPVVVAVLSRVR